MWSPVIVLVSYYWSSNTDCTEPCDSVCVCVMFNLSGPIKCCKVLPGWPQRWDQDLERTSTIWHGGRSTPWGLWQRGTVYDRSIGEVLQDNMAHGDWAFRLCGLEQNPMHRNSKLYLPENVFKEEMRRWFWLAEKHSNCASSKIVKHPWKSRRSPRKFAKRTRYLRNSGFLHRCCSVLCWNDEACLIFALKLDVPHTMEQSTIMNYDSHQACQRPFCMLASQEGLNTMLLKPLLMTVCNFW